MAGRYNSWAGQIVYQMTTRTLGRQMLSKLKTLIINVICRRENVVHLDQAVNLPVKYMPTGVSVNERIVELPFVLNEIDFSNQPNVLDFGCSRSLISLHLASMGCLVTGVDFRDYEFSHPRFRFWKSNILDVKCYDAFDYIIAVSVIEHIGLGVYDQNKNVNDLMEILSHLAKLLKPNGTFLCTTPFGLEYEDSFLRSFSTAQLRQAFFQGGLVVKKAEYYYRDSEQHWYPSDEQTCSSISNSQQAREGKSGVNSVVCLALSKASAL